jgi:hypothetical protein
MMASTSSPNPRLLVAREIGKDFEDGADTFSSVSESTLGKQATKARPNAIDIVDLGLVLVFVIWAFVSLTG